MIKKFNQWLNKPIQTTRLDMLLSNSVGLAVYSLTMFALVLVIHFGWLR